MRNIILFCFTKIEISANFMRLRLKMTSEIYHELASLDLRAALKYTFYHYYFLLPISRESIVLGSKWTFWWIDTIWGLLDPKITFLAFSLCVCVCVSVISITQKQITAETSNFVFYICITYRCYLKLFMKIGQKLCVQGHTK